MNGPDMNNQPKYRDQLVRVTLVGGSCSSRFYSRGTIKNKIKIIIKNQVVMIICSSVLNKAEQKLQ